LLGAGAEFALRNGLGLRAEAIAFDEDASLVQIGVIYRLGKTIELSRDSGQSSDDPQSDSDEDGVVFADDNCPDTPSNIAVDENGCAVFNGVVDGVEFLPASAKLTPGARTVLDTVADSLIELADARALIAAHTDSAGDAGVNMQLSQWRAFEVARYLVNRGVDAARLEARAFGETRPIDVNSTSQGRRNNRRVEITLIAE
jgi:outer membrane protein OmpA-like peptidoglycan-associated protein